MLLRKSRVKKVLGNDIEGRRVSEILHNLGFPITENTDGWHVEIPSYRFDIDVEDALVEEVARIFGYDQIPEVTAIAETPLAMASETRIDLDLVANTLVARDYQEVITYSFVGQEINTRITGTASKLILTNPISPEMSVMRSSVWPGVLDTASSNVARQHERVRTFEICETFHRPLKAPH